MTHEIRKVQSAEIVAPYTIKIIFDDTSCKTINFLPVLRGEMYGPLQNTDLFNRVKVDEEANTLVWPNGADYDPALLYNWEEHVDELKQRARQWVSVGS